MPITGHNRKTNLKFIKLRNPQHLPKHSLSLQCPKIHEIQIKMQRPKIRQTPQTNPQHIIKHRYVQSNVPRIQSMGINRSLEIWK